MYCITDGPKYPKCSCLFELYRISLPSSISYLIFIYCCFEYHTMLAEAVGGSAGKSVENPTATPLFQARKDGLCVTSKFCCRYKISHYFSQKHLLFSYLMLLFFWGNYHKWGIIKKQIIYRR